MSNTLDKRVQLKKNMADPQWMAKRKKEAAGFILIFLSFVIIASITVRNVINGEKSLESLSLSVTDRAGQYVATVPLAAGHEILLFLGFALGAGAILLAVLGAAVVEDDDDDFIPRFFAIVSTFIIIIFAIFGPLYGEVNANDKIKAATVTFIVNELGIGEEYISDSGSKSTPDTVFIADSSNLTSESGTTGAGAKFEISSVTEGEEKHTYYTIVP